MVRQETSEVGFATASGGDGHPFNILVCRYNPGGIYQGQKPFGQG